MNIQHIKTWNFLFMWVIFGLLDLDPDSGSTDLTESGSETLLIELASSVSYQGDGSCCSQAWRHPAPRRWPPSYPRTLPPGSPCFLEYQTCLYEDMWKNVEYISSSKVPKSYLFKAFKFIFSLLRFFSFGEDPLFSKVKTIIWHKDE